jgi:predicted PurR-regulated permease PerM
VRESISELRKVLWPSRNELVTYAFVVIVFVVIMVYQQIENHLIQPAVYRRTVQMPALVVLIAVLVGAALLGILGALIAIPIAGTIQVVVRDLLRERAERISVQEPGAT